MNGVGESPWTLTKVKSPLWLAICGVSVTHSSVALYLDKCGVMQLTLCGNTLPKEVTSALENIFQ